MYFIIGRGLLSQKRVPLKKGGRTHTHYMFMRKLNLFYTANTKAGQLLATLPHPVLLILGSAVAAAVAGLPVFTKPVGKAGSYLPVVPFVGHP
jgi:hypothetical protein